MWFGEWWLDWCIRWHCLLILRAINNINDVMMLQGLVPLILHLRCMPPIRICWLASLEHIRVLLLFSRRPVLNWKMPALLSISHIKEHSPSQMFLQHKISILKMSRSKSWLIEICIVHILTVKKCPRERKLLGNGWPISYTLSLLIFLVEHLLGQYKKGTKINENNFPLNITQPEYQLLKPFISIWERELKIHKSDSEKSYAKLNNKSSTQHNKKFCSLLSMNKALRIRMWKKNLVCFHKQCWWN